MSSDQCSRKHCAQPQATAFRRQPRKEKLRNKKKYSKRQIQKLALRPTIALNSDAETQA